MAAPPRPVSSCAAPIVWLLVTSALASAAGPARGRALGRRALASGAGAAALGAALGPAAQPARALIRGAKATGADAAALGVVGLFISMADCEVCIKDLPAACTGVLVGPQLVLSASHCLDLTEGLGGKLTKARAHPRPRSARATHSQTLSRAHPRDCGRAHPRDWLDVPTRSAIARARSSLATLCLTRTRSLCPSSGLCSRRSTAGSRTTI